jgi:hypothetical protein
MNKEYKKRKNMSAGKIVIIACYRRPYTKESLVSIENLLKNEKVEQVFILSITELKKPGINIENYLGLKDIKKFKNKVEEDKTIRASRYTNRIIEICEKLDIDFEKIEKKGKASKIILEEAKKHNTSYIVVHKSDKSKIDKRLSGSVSNEVCKKSMCIVKIL